MWRRHASTRRLGGPLATPLIGVLGAAVLTAAAAAGWATARPATAPTPTPTPTPTVALRSTPSPSSTPSPTPTPSRTPSPSRSPSPSLPAGLTVQDVAAGLTAAQIPDHGSGRLRVVPGDVPAPAGARRKVRVRVEVEGGLPVDGARFARFALATLNDRRSWARDGWGFARTDGAADVRLVLASPRTSAQLCRPLRTYGKLSCHTGGVTVLTAYRWLHAVPDYGADRTGYRRYLVNHEVGHALGHDHVGCPGAGRPAPVMMQQTKGLRGCRPNSWPYP